MKIKAEYEIKYTIRARPGYYKVNPDYSEYDVWAMVRLPNGNFRILDPVEFGIAPAYVKDVKDVDKWIEENFEPKVKAYCEDCEDAVSVNDFLARIQLHALERGNGQ